MRTLETTSGTIGEFALTTLATRQIRQSTVDSYLGCVLYDDLWDEALEDLSLQLVYERTQEQLNQNTRRKHTIAYRSIFREYPWIRELKIPASIARVYEFPSEDTIRFALMMSPFELQGLLMMYGGLRPGEACAMSNTDLKGNILLVHKQRIKNGRMVTAKTAGQVVLPQWLAERLAHHEPTIMTSGSLRESLYRYGQKAGIHLNPGLLRHWYISKMVNNKVSPKIAQKQARHSDVQTTLKYYTNFSKEQLDTVVEDLYGGDF